MSISVKNYTTGGAVIINVTADNLNEKKRVIKDCKNDSFTPEFVKTQNKGCNCALCIIHFCLLSFF